jgi:acid phosphatase family membrane protein YuiD
MPGYLRELIANDVLWVSVIASSMAQFLKPFTYWYRTREFHWSHIAETGGMPSSHSALVSAVATGVGLRNGFDSVTFALAVVLAMIVTYDAAGVRRQAGTHARVLNQIIAEVLEGRPPAEIPLEELLGHSRKEVAIGILFGVGVMLLWNFVLRPLFR